MLQLFESKQAGVEGLREVAAEFEKRRSTWLALHDFQAKVDAWQLEAPATWDHPAVRIAVEGAAAGAHRACKAQKGDLVALRLLDAVKAFRDTVPLR